jgi:hypothetical protein
MYFYAGAPHEAAGAVTIERGIGGTKGHWAQRHSTAPTPACAGDELALFI